MFVGVEMMEHQPTANLYYVNDDDTYELHLEVDDGLVVISLKDHESVKRLAEIIRASTETLPDMDRICEDCAAKR